MANLVSLFKGVSITFAISAVVTGIQALRNPINFSRTFGLRLDPKEGFKPGESSSAGKDSAPNAAVQTVKQDDHSLAMAYVSLMGVRQLATGIILWTFILLNKWTEVATILAIIGIVVAGTDGVYLSRAGLKDKGIYHALPGALISALACVALYLDV